MEIVITDYFAWNNKDLNFLNTNKSSIYFWTRQKIIISQYTWEKKDQQRSHVEFNLDLNRAWLWYGRLLSQKLCYHLPPRVENLICFCPSISQEKDLQPNFFLPTPSSTPHPKDAHVIRQLHPLVVFLIAEKISVSHTEKVLTLLYFSTLFSFLSLFISPFFHILCCCCGLLLTDLK